MKQSLPRLLSSLALVLVAGCGGDGNPSGGEPGGFPPMPVEIADVRAEGMVDRFAVVGDLSAEFEIDVVAEIAGRVLELSFSEGAAVAAGDRIARLDDAQLLAEARRAAALVQQRQSAHERIRALVDQRAGAPQDLDDAAADLAVAEADQALARARLAKARIAAPFAGITGIRRVSPGAYLQPGETITSLAGIDRIRVNFAAPERYLGRLQVGARVQVRTSAYPELALSGTVDVIDPVLDRVSRSAHIVAHVDNADHRLRPGMSAEVSVILDERKDALTVPAEAVFFQGGQAFVYTVAADSTVGLAPVVLGTRDAALVEITSGLAAGQSVVRAGHQKLFPGARVMPVPDAGAGAAPGAADDEGAAS